MAATGTARARRPQAARVRVLTWLLVALGASAHAVPAAGEQLEVTASHEGFRPRVISVRKGETLRVLLSTADEEHCFAVDGLRVEKRIVPGRTTTLDLTPDRVGTFPFYCCLESGKAAELERGRLIVSE